MIPRSIASVAVAAAVAFAVALPAQAGFAAPVRTMAGGSHARTSSPVLADRADDPDSGSSDDSGDDAGDSSDPVQVVDGTDAPEDDTDVLADDSSSSSGSAARRGTTSGRWAQVARPAGVQARMTGASRARVTWRSSVGGLLAQRFVVELRTGGSVLRATTFSSARSATFWTLAPGKRYSVSVAAVAADGTRRLASGAAIRTPAAMKAVKPAKASTSSTPAASSSKAAARHAKAARLG